jgi:hypothetical protein
MKRHDEFGFDGTALIRMNPARLIPRRRPYMEGTQCGLRETRRSMTTFDKREDAFEKRYAHDEELRFKANARRNKRLGLWVAEKLGVGAAEADAYAKSVVMSDFEEAGDHDVLRKVRADLDAKGRKDISDKELRRVMDEFLAQAIEEIKAGR